MNEKVTGTIGTARSIARSMPATPVRLPCGERPRWQRRDDVAGQRIEVRISTETTTNTSTYKNHGQYVKAMGGGDDAAHSCIGMPINSNQ